MDESTRLNAAMVEQASAAAGSMNEQAARLSQLTAFFRERHAAVTGAGAAVATATLTANITAAGTPRPAVLIERRAGSRPWMKPVATAAVAQAVGGHDTADARDDAGRPAAKASGGGDWSEF
jgi:methyl-accepting chemotaxis protein